MLRGEVKRLLLYETPQGMKRVGGVGRSEGRGHYGKATVEDRKPRGHNIEYSYPYGNKGSFKTLPAVSGGSQASMLPDFFFNFPPHY